MHKLKFAFVVIYWYYCWMWTCIVHEKVVLRETDVGSNHWLFNNLSGSLSWTITLHDHVLPGCEIVPNTGTNATKFFTLVTKSWKLVAKLVTRMFHHDLTCRYSELLGSAKINPRQTSSLSLIPKCSTCISITRHHIGFKLQVSLKVVYHQS